MFRHQSMASLIVFLSFIILPKMAFAHLSPQIHKHSQSVVFELEFIPNADLKKTVNFLRAEGFSAEIAAESKNTIQILAESYTKAMDKLSQIVPNLPDISNFIWKNGISETVLYEAKEANILINQDELTVNQKAVTEFGNTARMTLVLKDDKKSVIKYESIVRKIENMGYKVTFAEGYMDAGWAQIPAIDIDIPNNIISARDTVLKLSEIPEVSRLMYNRGTSPHTNEYILTFKAGTDFDLLTARLLANGIEVYKVDKLINRIFIHFPKIEERNNIKLDQIKMLDDLVIIKNIHENQEQFKDSEYSKNLKTIWLDVPEEILKGRWRNNEYAQILSDIAKNEVLKIQAQGMIVVRYGVYHETGEVLIPELVFTHSDSETPKAEAIKKEYDKSPYKVAAENTVTDKIVADKISAAKIISKKPIVNTCASLFQ